MRWTEDSRGERAPLVGPGREQALALVAARAREDEEARRHRARSDVQAGAQPEQVPAEGWVP